MNQTTKGAEIAPLGDFRKSLQDGLAKAMEVPRKMLETNLQTSAELITFCGRRMQAQAELFDVLRRCGTIDEAAAAQRSFFEKANEQYAIEMKHFMEIARANLSLVTDAMIEPPPAAKN